MWTSCITWRPCRLTWRVRQRAEMQTFFEWDARLSARLRVAERPGKRRRLAIIFGHSGDSWFWLLGLLLAFWLGDETWRRLAIVMIAGILLTAVIVLLI